MIGRTMRHEGLCPSARTATDIQNPIRLPDVQVRKKQLFLGQVSAFGQVNVFVLIDHGAYWPNAARFFGTILEKPEYRIPVYPRWQLS